MKLSISRLILDRFKDKIYQPDNLLVNPDFTWISKQSNLPWLKLDIEVPVDKILNEIKAVQHLLVPHRETYGEHYGWDSFCIHGRGYNLTREDSHYTNPPDYHWTPEALQLMPETVNYFRTQWPGSEYRRVRIMRLAPGGYITVHSDSDIPQLNPINIAITQPANCHFVMEKFGKVPYTKGSAFWLDVSNRHVVFNDSDQDRWHIIVHQKIDDIKFQNLVVKSYKLLYNMYNENRNNYN